MFARVSLDLDSSTLSVVHSGDPVATWEHPDAEGYALASVDLDPERWTIGAGTLCADSAGGVSESVEVRHRATGRLLSDLYGMIDITDETIDTDAEHMPCDLADEYRDLAEGTEIEVYSVIWYLRSETGDAEHGTVLYLPAIGRAGVCDGACSSWTDCTDADDAVRRYLTGRMVE